MEKILSDHDRSHLNLLIEEAEKRANTQIVLAVIRRSDSYAELPWKAFALGSSVAGLLSFILSLLLISWNSQMMILITVSAILAVGVVLALLSVFTPGFARLFLSAHRAEEEVQQYAESLFLSRELFATTNRTGILLLVSLFERRVFLLPDKGIGNRLTLEEMQHVIAPMTLLLRRNKVSKALEEGLRQLSMILEAKNNGESAHSKENELPNEIIEEKGV